LFLSHHAVKSLLPLVISLPHDFECEIKLPKHLLRKFLSETLIRQRTIQILTTKCHTLLLPLVRRYTHLDCSKRTICQAKFGNGRFYNMVITTFPWACFSSTYRIASAV
jgi:hypothetical protein